MAPPTEADAKKMTVKELKAELEALGYLSHPSLSTVHAPCACSQKTPTHTHTSQLGSAVSVICLLHVHLCCGKGWLWW
jgi:hypothetical protein